MVTSDFLQRVPVFADLSDELLAQLAEESIEREVAAGEWLLREGDQADELFVIRSGRLEVVDEGPPETVIRELKRGEAVGELALLSRGRRSASVRARRDTDLIGLGRDSFEALIGSEPAFAIGLTRVMGAQLAANRAAAPGSPRPSTVAVVALDEGVNVKEHARLLVDSLGAHGSVAELEHDPDRSADEMASVLDKAEGAADRVVLVGSSSRPGDLWTDFCLREADLVVAVTRVTPAPGWTDRPEALRGCELMVDGPGIALATADAFKPREVQVLGDKSDLRAAYEVLARRIAGNSLGVVFSGGGARAFAHLGVMEEIEASGLKVDRIAGVSLGSIVGAGLADGRSPAELAELFQFGFVENNPTGDYSLPLYSLIRGERARRLLHELFGEVRIEELERRFFCLSCDLVGREPVIHRTGPLRDAVMASLSIPAIFPPIPTEDGKLLVDGGVLDNLPVETMASSREGPVIAVDVTGQMADFRRPVRPGLERTKRPLRRVLTGSQSGLPRLAESIVRTVTVGSIDTSEAARRHADLVIQPEVDGVGLLEWDQLDRVREAGRIAARPALESAHELLSAYRGGESS